MYFEKMRLILAKTEDETVIVCHTGMSVRYAAISCLKSLNLGAGETECFRFLLAP